MPETDLLDVLPERPRTRAECPESEPCPWVGCKYHLYLDVNPDNGAIKFNFPDLEPWELAASCALNVAERRNGDCNTLQEVSDLVNVTRERVRQIVDRALARLSTPRRRRK